MIAPARREYSPVRHLALTLCPSLDARRFRLAMFSAFFDASGNHDNVRHSGAYYVCGFVASLAKWKQLETAWPALLDQYDMPRPFRMAEFMARNQKTPNAFTGWPGDTARQYAFRQDAAKLTHRCTNKPFAVGVVNAALRRLFNEYDVPTDIPREPYPWCALRATDHLFEWALHRIKATPALGKEHLEVVFEKGDYHQDVFAEAVYAKHGHEVDFRTNIGKTSVPFAACDWLAWECRHWMTNRERGMARINAAKSYFYAETERIERLKAAQFLMEDSAILTEIGRLMPSDALTYANWDALKRMAERRNWPRKC